MKAGHGLIVGVLIVCASLNSLWAEEKTSRLNQLQMVDYGGVIYRASSTLKADHFSDIGRYGMHTLFDGDRHTAWSEGNADEGIGVVLWLRMEAGDDTLLIQNGFARTEALFAKNNRVRALELSLWQARLPDGMVSETGPLYVISPLGKSHTLILDDTRSLQEHPLPLDSRIFKQGVSVTDESYLAYARQHELPPEIARQDLLLRLEIREVYPGSHWNDTCLTELRLFSRRNVKAVEVWAEEGVLLYKPTAERQRVLYKSREYLYDPYLVSKDGRWCVTFQAPVEAEGRVETSYALFRLPYPRLHPHPGFEQAIFSGLIPIDFVETNEGLFLSFDDESRIKLE